MNAPKGSTTFSYGYPAALLALILLGCSAAIAQTKSTKPAPAPAPAKPAAAPARPAARPAGGAGTPNTAHGPTTASHGVTTANGGRGVSTPNGGHGVTTGNREREMPAGRTSGTYGRAAVGHPGEPRSNRMVHTANGGEVRMRPNGRPADVHMANRGIDIHHGLNGNRRVEVERADHSRIVAERGGRGYVQHPYRYGGRDFAHRTYYYHGRAYDRYYGQYYYHGAYLDYYTPAYYYRPAFYGWAYNPWGAPVPYAWGWAGNPWYGYYGAYFTPYPVYPSASVWLTDYLISTSLAAAYQAQVDANIAAQQPAQRRSAFDTTGEGYDRGGSAAPDCSRKR